MADVLGISRSAVAMWETGGSEPDNKTLEKIADYFNVSIDYLVNGEEFSGAIVLDFSNSEDKELLDKFHALSPELRAKLLGYIDGMLAAMPKTDNSEERLSI